MDYDITISVYEKDTTNQIYRNPNLTFDTINEKIKAIKKYCELLEVAKIESKI